MLPVPSKYRAGKNNQDADGLSRRPHDSMTDDYASLEEKERIKRFTSHHLSSFPNQQDLPVDAVLCQHHLLNEAPNDSPCVTLVESLAIHPDSIPDTYENDDVLVVLPYLPTIQKSLKSLHEDVGHTGLERTLDLVRTRFIGQKWLQMWSKRLSHVGVVSEEREP